MNESKNLKVKELKGLARGQLIGKYGISILAVMIVSMINYMIFIIEMTVLGESTSSYLIGLLIDLIVSLLFGIFTFGEAYFFLKIARNDKSVSIKDVFTGFMGFSDRAILIQAVFTLLSFLGNIPSILLTLKVIVVPDEYYNFFNFGVIALQALLIFFAKFYFGLAFYVLADNKNFSAKDALVRSYELMKKQKGRFFTVYLSSVPLALASIIACGIGFLWFNVYFNTLLADFYLDIIGETPYSITPVDQTTAGPSDDSAI